MPRNDPKITINIALIATMARSKVCATSLSKVSRILILTMLQQHLLVATITYKMSQEMPKLA